jgi:hypothetical protein
MALATVGLLGNWRDTMREANEGVRFLTDILGGPGNLMADSAKLVSELWRASTFIHQAARDVEAVIERRLIRERKAGRFTAKSDKAAGTVARRYAATCRLPGVSAALRAELLDTINWRRLGRHVLAA